MSRYNSFQLKVQRRFSRGLRSMLSYTWSRSIDTSSGWFSAENGIGGGGKSRTTTTSTRNRAVSSYDVPHIVTWADDLGAALRARQALAERAAPASWILGNWQLNWFAAGPLGPADDADVGGDPANIGLTGYARANLVGDPELANPDARPVVQRGGLRDPGELVRQRRAQHPARAELLERGPRPAEERADRRQPRSWSCASRRSTSSTTSTAATRGSTIDNRPPSAGSRR